MDDSQLLLEDAVTMTSALTNSSAVSCSIQLFCDNPQRDVRNDSPGLQVEALGAQLDQWCLLLRKHVDNLVVGLKITEALENIYRAESYAHRLQSNAHSLHRYKSVHVSVCAHFCCFCIHIHNFSRSALCHQSVTSLGTAANWLSLIMTS